MDFTHGTYSHISTYLINFGEFLSIHALKKFTDTQEGNSETGFVTQLKLSEFSQETFTLENHDYG